MRNRLAIVGIVSAVAVSPLLAAPSVALELAPRQFFNCQVLAATGNPAFVQVPANSEEGAREFAAKVAVVDQGGAETTVQSVVQCLAVGDGVFKDREFQRYVETLER